MTQGVGNYLAPPLGNCLTLEGSSLGNYLIADILRFHLAPLEGDPHLHDRVEGAIGRYYKSHPLPELSTFITPGLRLPAAIPGDRPMKLVVASEAPIAGLPVELLEPSPAAAEPLCSSQG